MSYEILLALAGFAFVTSITPGPNNIMLMMSGVAFGFRRTVPHMLGIGVGFMVMVFLVGVGLAQLFVAYPALEVGLKAVSAVYLVWLAWKLVNASAPDAGEARRVPINFWQAAAFQWVNPKAWAMAVTAVTYYAPGQTVVAMLLVALVFGLINLPCVSCWTVLGMRVRQLLSSPRRLWVFNLTMGGLLVLSLVPVLLG